MRQRLMSGWIAIAIGLTVSPLIAADDGDNNPVPSPTTRPTATQPVPRTDPATVRKWVSQLASDNYQTRNAARVALMGLKRQELDTLRQAIKQNLPLAPNQIITIREVFTQVYLAGDVYI